MSGLNLQQPRESFQSDFEMDPDEKQRIYFIERQLFLRAALQLLDERENGASSNAANTFNNDSLSPRYSFRSDVIRFGKLKKANRRNALSSFSSLVWKCKVVEIKYGVFYYEDEVVSKNDFVENVFRKSIILSAHSTTCREVKVQGIHANCVFRLSCAGGVKRTFLASSPSDRDAWMKAIFTAMPTILSPRILSSSGTERILEKKKNSFTLFGSSKEQKSSLESKTPAEAHDILMSSSQTSLPGPAAKYANDVVSFCKEQEKFILASNEEEYRQIVYALREQNATLRIPNVRSNPDENNDFCLAPEDALSQNTLSTLATSQVWKDLQRDQVLINGELVLGQTRGAEGIVAALTRHIMNAAHNTKRFSASPHASQTPLEGGYSSPRNDARKTINSLSNHVKAPASPSKEGNGVLSRFSKMLSNMGSEQDSSNSADNSFSLSEAHALSCAKDVLVLCNRTQSGGDTYFCVESFLAKCGMDGKTGDRLCVLTPLETESDPLEISVNVGFYSVGCDVKVIDGSIVSNHTTMTSNSSNESPPQTIANIRASIRLSQSALANKINVKNHAPLQNSNLMTHENNYITGEDSKVRRSDTISTSNTTIDSNAGSSKYINNMNLTTATTTHVPWMKKPNHTPPTSHTNSFSTNASSTQIEEAAGRGRAMTIQTKEEVVGTNSSVLSSANMKKHQSKYEVFGEIEKEAEKRMSVNTTTSNFSQATTVVMGKLRENQREKKDLKSNLLKLSEDDIMERVDVQVKEIVKDKNGQVVEKYVDNDCLSNLDTDLNTETNDVNDINDDDDDVSIVSELIEDMLNVNEDNTNLSLSLLNSSTNNVLNAKDGDGSSHFQISLNNSPPPFPSDIRKSQSAKGTIAHARFNKDDMIVRKRAVSGAHNQPTERSRSKSDIDKTVDLLSPLNPSVNGNNSLEMNTNKNSQVSSSGNRQVMEYEVKQKQSTLFSLATNQITNHTKH